MSPIWTGGLGVGCGDVSAVVTREDHLYDLTALLSLREVL